MPITPEERKELLERQYLQATKNEVLEKMRTKAPLLYWTKKNHVNTKGDDLDFRDMYYLIALYKNWHKWPLVSVIKSVQVGLSELFIASSHMEASEGLTVMYVLPKYEIRNRFVNNRISRLHKKSPAYARFAKAARDEGGSHRTSLMHFGRGGIAYVGSNVEDEFIEIPVDSSYVDEYDRCNQKNLLLLPDRLTASPYKYRREISNPTIEEYGIDSRYKQGSRAEWHICCEHCSTWFRPDFFEHVVQEIGSNLYRVRDKSYNPDDKGSTALICPKCGKRVNRLSRGEWVHEFPSRDWKSLRISQLVNKHVSLTNISTEWLDIGANKTKQQVFYNSILGRAYSSAGSKVLAWQLDRCRRPYRWPVTPAPAQGVRTMGADVGATLHYVIRERVTDQGLDCRKLLCAGEARSFEELAKIIRIWEPKRVVIDANPEIHEVAKLKDKFSSVYSSRFQIDLIEMYVDKKDRHVKMDRTAALDAVKAEVDGEQLLLPMLGSELHHGLYYAHMEAPTRLLDENEGNADKSRYIWAEGSKPDHFFLAEVYCAQADALIPKRTAFQFFANEAEETETKIAKNKNLENLLERGRKGDTEGLAALTPEIFHTTVDRNYNPAVKTQDIDTVDQEILSVAEAILERAGGVDLLTFCRGSGLSEKKAEAFLIRFGFEETGHQMYAKRSAE